MIELTLTELAMWVIGGSMGLVVLCAWYSRWAAGCPERRALENRLNCRVCLHIFEDSTSREVADCPNCGAACQRGRSRTLG